ncbi:hypothetical protein IQ255_23090 [Pleurocapsales cyanobacterium LEGE 10410]|nr:hypothetical protein [Pleurocapsales cyanobacterium LEGE 10410]
MNDLQWLTRVPLSIKEASTLVNEVGGLKPSTVKGYKLGESSSEYGGVPQRGMAVQLKGLRTQVDPHWKRGISYPKIGIRWLNGVLHTNAFLPWE